MSNDDFATAASNPDESTGGAHLTVNFVDEVRSVRGPEPDPWHEPHKGRLLNEVPFRTELTVGEWPLAERLALTPARRGVADARSALIANVMYADARSAETWVFYSRDRNHYAERARARRYTCRWYTYANMMPAVESLEEAGLLYHQKTAPSPRPMYRSRIRASALLLKSLEGVYLPFVVEPREVIILRDARRLPIGYRDSKRICAQRDDVIAHNEFLASFDIRVDHADARYDEKGFLRLESHWLDPRRKFYHRIFTERWSSGGRWYGPFWQSLPGNIRRCLRLNGEAVFEADYRACHLRLLCAQAGVDLPFDEVGYDPYALPGIPRRHVKISLQILLNAETRASARGAIVGRLHIGHTEADKLMKKLRSHWPGLERYWSSGVGLKLQNCDAEICARVQRHLRRAGIPALSIHDSFIVPRGAGPALEEVMAEEMARVCAKLACRK